MKILVDENIPWETAQTLRDQGHDVLDIRGTADEGMDDELLWGRSQLEERLLITTDKGFTKYRHTAHSGVLIVRLRQPNLFKIHKRVIEGMSQIKEEQWTGLLVVMRDDVLSVFRAQQKDT